MLTFDGKNHFYFWNGVRKPSTTQVCALLAPRTWNVAEYYLNKGRIIHLLTEYEDNEVLDGATVDPSLSGYLSAYRKFKGDSKFRVIETEVKFYSPRWGYCGRVDKYGEMFNKLCVLDLKSGPPHGADKYQSAAYLFGMKDAGFKAWRAWNVYLRADGTYRLLDQRRPSELFSKFLKGISEWKPE